MQGLTALSLLLFATSTLAVIQTVPFSDPRIQYSGNGWHSDVFEIRQGIDPATGGGVNGTDASCALGDKSTSSGVLGDGFTFSFSGVAIQLVLESRDDHGFVQVTLDGIPSTISTYSTAPHCGIAFEQGVQAGQHTISVSLAGRNPASRWPDTYVQIFSIRFDDGLAPSSSITASSTGSSLSSAPTKSNGSPKVTGESVSHSNTGAIVGGVIGGVILGLALAGLVTYLIIRRKRAAQAAHDEVHLNPSPFIPPSSGAPRADQSRFYNNATSYYPSEPSRGAPPSEFTGTYPVSTAPSINRSGVGTLHDEDVERIAGRLVQLVQAQGAASVYGGGSAPSVYGNDASYSEQGHSSPPPIPDVPQVPTAKQLYIARQQAPDAPGVTRGQAAPDEPPPY